MCLSLLIEANVNIDSENVLSPNGTKQLSKPMLIYWISDNKL